MGTLEEARILKLDFFRYTPVRLREQTVLGALLSLGVLFIAGSIIYSRVDRAFGEGVKSELLFENLKMSDVEVTIDIDLLTVPCELVDLRFTSKRGVANSLSRYILRNPMDPPQMHKIEYFSGNRDLDSVVKATQDKEGCKIKGFFHLHFLSNNFFVGFGNQILMSQVRAKNPQYKLGLDHHIN